MRPDDNALAPDTIGQNSNNGNIGQNSGEADHMADDTKNDDTIASETETRAETEAEAEAGDETQQAAAPEAAEAEQTEQTEQTGQTVQEEQASDADAAMNHTAAPADDHAVPAVDLEDHDIQDFHDDSDSDETDMSAMARLLDEQETQFKSIKRGDVVEGQIVHMDDDEILVDIGLKSEGVLSIKELPPTGYGSREELHVGDNVLVYVVQPETPEGHAIVSIKRARLERQWRIAQEQYERGELLEAEVIDFNKGGLIVNLDGIRGFVPPQGRNARRAAPSAPDPVAAGTHPPSEEGLSRSAGELPHLSQESAQRARRRRYPPPGRDVATGGCGGARAGTTTPELTACLSEFSS